MAKFCGGFKFNPTSLKLIKGILCLSDAQDADITKAVTGCGQMWDGETFKIVKVDGYKPCITLKTNGHPVQNILIGNCGISLDGEFFMKGSSTQAVSVVNGYILKITVVPSSAQVVVMNEAQEVIQPTGINTYTLSDIDAKYSVTVSEKGYIGQSRTIVNNQNQSLILMLSNVLSLYNGSIDIQNKATYGDVDQYVVSFPTPIAFETGQQYQVTFDHKKYIVTAQSAANTDVTGSYTLVYLGTTNGDIKIGTAGTIENPSFTDYPFMLKTKIDDKGELESTSISATKAGNYELKIIPWE